MGPIGRLPSSPKNTDDDVGVFGSAPLGYHESSRHLLLHVQGEQMAKDPNNHLPIYTNLLTDSEPELLCILYLDLQLP
jgi:hypothetical protein